MRERLKSTDLLYSTGTLLAYKISERYYRQTHFVWCTSSFDTPAQPGTSNPRTLCTRYLEQVMREDRHAEEINRNKVGILKGAHVKFSGGSILEKDYQEICSIVACAEYESFLPVIYIIKWQLVKKRCQLVHPGEAASDCSVEYIISDLRHGEFDLISVKDILGGAVGITRKRAGE